MEILAKGHHLPVDLQIPEMIEYARKALRIEGVTRQQELKDVLCTLHPIGI